MRGATDKAVWSGIVLNSQSFVPFDHPLRALERTDLQPPCPQPDAQMRNCRVLGFTRSRRVHRRPARGPHSVESDDRLPERTGLIDLNQRRVSRAIADLSAAAYAMEELEETAKLIFPARGVNPNMLTPDEVAAVADAFGTPGLWNGPASVRQ